MFRSDPIHRTAGSDARFFLSVSAAHAVVALSAIRLWAAVIERMRRPRR